MSLSAKEKVALRRQSKRKTTLTGLMLYHPASDRWIPAQADEEGRLVIDPSDLDTRYLMVDGSNYMKANASVRPQDAVLTGRGLLGTLQSGYAELAPCIRLWNLLDNKKFLMMFTQGYPLDYYYLNADDSMISNPMYFDGTTMTYECNVDFVGELRGSIARIVSSWQNLAVGLGFGSITITFSFTWITDGTYGILVTPNWSTRVWVTGKTSTQFVVNFSVVAPAGATIDVMMFKDPSST